MSWSINLKTKYLEVIKAIRYAFWYHYLFYGKLNKFRYLFNKTEDIFSKKTIYCVENLNI